MDLYTNVSALWRCAASAPAGWEAPGFDASSWVTPKQYGSSADAGFNTNARRIFCIDTGNRDFYIRLGNPSPIICDIPVSGSSTIQKVKYTTSSPNNDIYYTLVTHTTSRSLSDCAATCLRNATSCQHSGGKDCVVPSGGCCGFSYHGKTRSGVTFTRVKDQGLSPGQISGLFISLE